jgi:hypothetical protein
MAGNLEKKIFNSEISKIERNKLKDVFDNNEFNKPTQIYTPYIEKNINRKYKKIFPASSSLEFELLYYYLIRKSMLTGIKIVTVLPNLDYIYQLLQTKNCFF